MDFDFQSDYSLGFHRTAIGPLFKSTNLGIIFELYHPWDQKHSSC